MAYAGLVCGKGPYYYVTLRKQLGDPRFFAALRQYVQRFRFGFAGPQDFTDIAFARAGKDGAKVRALARRWLEDAHGDDDLGKPNMGSLLGGMSGGGDGGGSMQKVLKALGADGIQDLLKGFAGGGKVQR
jgi:hypothetical protein